MFVIHVASLGPDGMALFPFILVRHRHPGAVLLNHERIHLQQQLELGIIFFYVWYLLEYVIRRFQYRGHYAAYRNISFEREAFYNEQDLTYLRTRSFWTFWRYIKASE